MNQFKDAFREQKNIPSGFAPVPVKFKYFESMLFLKDHIERPNVISSLNGRISRPDSSNSPWRKME